MLCAISGEAPREPVASRKSGNVFEKRLIEAHIADYHTDPVSGEDLAVEDLIELKSPQVVAPRPPNLTSIPALLSAFQNEWDSIVLETHTLKQQLAQTRQELSTALYQNDAATRVIARLSRERDDARAALSSVTVSGAAASNGDAMQVDGQALPEDLAAKIDETQQQLFATRRKRPIPDGWATADDISTFDVSATTDPLYPGSNNVALNESGDLALFGGADGVAGVYSISQAKVVDALKAGSAVTATAWWGDRAIVATAAGTTKIFEEGSEIAQVGLHAGPATALALHPSGALLATVGADKSFAFHDLSTFNTVSQVYVEAEITSCAFHVDGLLFFVGSSDGKIRIFDTKTGTAMAEIETGAPVLAISFSENGIWFAVVNKNSSNVSVWDVRKQNVIKVLETGSPVESTRWDYTGQYLAIAGSGSVSIQQYTKASKSWSELLRKAVAAKDVAWGADASSVVALTSEGGLSVLSVS
ncbi:Prp19-domain-containing protein [Pyrenochaeta sp. DS3sAY3a]|nr:Prp19-domain-containing protein [Pyrenochaeta sp. DS3sAY3a]